MANIVFGMLLIATTAFSVSNIEALSCYSCIYIEGSPDGYPSVEDCRQNPPSKYLESFPGYKLLSLSSKPLSNLAPHIQMAFGTATAPSTSAEKLVCATTFLDISVPAMPGLGFGAIDGNIIERSFATVDTNLADGCYSLTNTVNPPDGIQLRSFDQCICSSDACNNIEAPTAA